LLTGIFSKTPKGSPSSSLLSVRAGEQSERMKLIPLFLLFGMLAVSGWAQRYSPELVQEAEAGDANAQHLLGCCYARGEGVGKDEKKAFEWFTKSANQGHVEAHTSLGFCYLVGIGVEIDEKEAVKWYTKSAEQGNARAQCYLGWCYSNGTGVAKDEKEAVKWYTKSAEQGNADAKKALEKLKSK
jgi:TPR repeat protein